MPYLCKAGILRRDEILAFNGMLGNHLSVQQPAGTMKAQPASLPSPLAILKWDLKLWVDAEESRSSLLGTCKQECVVCPAPSVPCRTLPATWTSSFPAAPSQRQSTRVQQLCGGTCEFHLWEHIYSHLYFGGACPCPQHTALNCTCYLVISIPLCHLYSSSSIHITERLVRRNIRC